jgi:DNA-binding PadR family transcriptional regulator
MPKQTTLQPTPLLLSVLVLLWEAPMHPYQMQRTMRERGKDLVTDVKPGSIYHAVQRLEKAGLAEAIETTREGRRPERTTYRITDNGRETCETWLSGMLARPKTEQPEFAAALAALPLLLPEPAREVLDERITQLQSQIDSLETGLRESVEMGLPRVLLVEVEYVLTLRKAEAAWVRELIDDLAKKRLDWNQKELIALGEASRSTESE